MTYSEKDIRFTQRALELAGRGKGLVSPNPLVGCVILAENGDIVGEGTYTLDGEVHAEAIALEIAGDSSRGGTAYVSLEPHDHQNKTPPCTDALINAGIRRVVCPIEDPNPKVSGRGFEHLRRAGLEVVTGILESEAEKLNEAFVCWHRKQRPFVHLKLAMSLDGRISIDNSVSTAISSEASRSRVHELRHEHDAILIGGNTALVDDPLLTDRSGKPRRRPLVRIVLDNQLRLDPTSKLANTATEAATIVFTNSRDQAKKSLLRSRGVEVIETPMGGRDLNAVLDVLKSKELQSVLVEGGSEIAGSFCDSGLVDKFTFFIAPLLIGGREAPSAIGGAGTDLIEDAMRLRDICVTSLGDDLEISGYPILKDQ